MLIGDKVNYPNSFKKTQKKIITYGNRGMDLESIINEANKYYLENDIAVIYKKPTPIGIVKVDYSKMKITEAYFDSPSTLDYNGIYQGSYIEFDAKVTKSKTSFPLNNIHPHQLEHIKKILKQKGICFLIISINDEYYALSGKSIINFINNEKRKSIPYEYIKKHGYIIKYNYNKGLDYINIINNIMEEKI
jgi:recombination protein U